MQVVESATAGRAARPVSSRRRHHRLRRIAGVTVALIVVAVVAVLGHFLDEPMRRRLEATLNQRLTGYSVRLPELDFHPIGLSLTLRGLSVRQNAHPEPPVIRIDTLDAGVHWRALLHLRLVADFSLDGLRLHVNRPQLMQEASDSVPVEDKGWQEALEAIYPLKINQFTITNGALTYIDDDPKLPLEITQARFKATNIRNARAAEGVYPSPIHLSAVVFDRGHLIVDGDANFLAEPHAAARAHIELHDVPLRKFKPVAAHANVHVSGGTLTDLVSDIEYAPTVQNLHVRRAIIDEVAVDYVHSPQTEVAETQRIEKVQQVTAEVAERPSATLTVDQFMLRKSTLGYVDQTRPPGYRLFLADATIDVRNISNQPNAGMGGINVTGAFMGSGKTQLEAAFFPRRSNPGIDMKLEIEQTDMRAMNDLFRAYGDFDVMRGQFSFYTEMHIKDGKVDGYIKPLFANIDVYDRRQDKDKALFQQLYEGLVGGIGTLLENRRDQVATQAEVKGEATSPKLSTWEVVVNLVRNAFFKAILPGFDAQLRRSRR